MNLELNSKKVLITGASRGIGLAIAKGFLQENARTCLVSRGSKALFEIEQELQKKYSVENIFASKCDCTKIKSLKNKVDPKITLAIWKSMIWSFVRYQKENFKKK